MKPFPTYRQYDAMDCGPTCLRMVSKHYGRAYTMDTLRQKSGINREGVSLLGISEAAEEIGFRTVGAKLTWEQLEEQAPLPCVVWWNQVHFVVVYKIKKKRVYVADPAKGKIKYTKEEFLRGWMSKGSSVVRHGEVSPGIWPFGFGTKWRTAKRYEENYGREWKLLMSDLL